jgi:hypothetical protein
MNTISKEDAKIIDLEREMRKYQRLTTASNNTEPDCTKFHNKAMGVLRQLSNMIYDSAGYFRKDKRHLLPWLEGDAFAPYIVQE